MSIIPISNLLSGIFMKKIRIASRIIKTLVKDSIHYPSRLYANIFIIVARLGVLLFLYKYVFQINDGVVNGVTFIVVAWSMFFYFIFSNYNLRRISRLIMEDVQSGNVEIFLNRPISYLFYKIWWTFGLGFYNFIFIGIVGFIVLSLLIGIPESMTIGLFIPTLILEFILTSILSIIIYSIVGLFAFWIEDINPVFWIVDKLVMILGGSYLPVALFPVFLYKIAIYSPFGASMFISHIVYDSWRFDWYKLMGIQILWIFVLGILLLWMFKRVKEKVSVNGG
jgi:ABC-2 type transport system permease protein